MARLLLIVAIVLNMASRLLSLVLAEGFLPWYCLALGMHETSSGVLGTAALSHGALLTEYAGLVEYV